MSDLSGKTLGTYEVQEQIGEGGMATVYRAYQPSMDRMVALKVLPAALAMDPQFVKRFEQEARTIASLEHARILPVYDYGTQGPTTYLAMRYLDGGTLRDRIERDGPFDPEGAAAVVEQVCEGLGHAHNKGVIHRDVTANNIMFDESGDATITDFGMARLMEQSSRLTGGSILGTPAYVSPEQGLGDPVDQRTDIYALGIVLYEMLIGEVPYQGPTPMAVVVQHINEPLPDPQAARPDLSDAVAAVIRRATAKNPADRYPTCHEFAAALKAAAAGNPVPSGRTSPAPRTVPLGAPAQDDRLPGWVLPVGIVAVLGIIVVVGGMLWQQFGPGPLAAAEPTTAPVADPTGEAPPDTPSAAQTVPPTLALPATDSAPGNPTEDDSLPAGPPDPVRLPPLDDGLITCEPPTQARYVRDYTAHPDDDLAIFGQAGLRFIEDTGNGLAFAAMPDNMVVPLLMNAALASSMIEMEVTWPDGPAALDLLTNSLPNGSPRYVFAVNADGTLSIAIPNMPPETNDPAIDLFDGAPHRLRFSAIQGMLTIGVDGQTLASATDPTPLPPGNLLMRVGQNRVIVNWLGVCAQTVGE